MVTRIRNRGCVPYLSSEGIFVKPLVTRKLKRDDCSEGLTPFQRMHLHHTLASARRFAHFKPFPGLIPKDSLDFILSSCYNESEEIFADKIDTLLQPDTEDIGTWRRLRNTRDLTPDREEQAAKKCIERERERERTRDEVESTDKRKKRKGPTIPYRQNFAHKVLIGGILEKKHPHNIKLMNSSHHSPQTNAGYSRQPSDGMIFQY